MPYSNVMSVPLYSYNEPRCLKVLQLSVVFSWVLVLFRNRTNVHILSYCILWRPVYYSGWKTAQIIPMIIYRIIANIELVLKHNWRDVIGYRRKRRRKLTLFIDYLKKFDIHKSVHRNINLIERTNKMRPCSRIYYSNYF